MNGASILFRRTKTRWTCLAGWRGRKNQEGSSSKINGRKNNLIPLVSNSQDFQELNEDENLIFLGTSGYVLRKRELYEFIEIMSPSILLRDQPVFLCTFNKTHAPCIQDSMSLRNLGKTGLRLPFFQMAERTVRWGIRSKGRKRMSSANPN